jgi:outer membrane protein assembly factor BamE (lipoprotein component of BamABCDE complex)
MLSYVRHHFNFYLIIIFFILNACQFQEPSNNHGILFLENRSEKLTLNSSNTNDVLKIIGYPHSKSINNENEWIYIERILTKGEYHKLGRNILKANNILVLNFNKYGILEKKTFLAKKDKNDLSFSKNKTQNIKTNKSFIENVLNSVKQKMYKNK